MSHSFCPRPTTVLAFIGVMGLSACAGNSGQASLQSAEAENTAALTQSSTYTLSPNMSMGRCVQTLNGATDNGTPIVLADCDGSPSQAWTKTGDDNSVSLVIDETKCIDVVNGANDNGTKLQLWDCFPMNDNQKWSFQNGQLQWLKTQKCFDVTDGLFADNASVLQVWDCTPNDDNQKWKFVASPTKTAASAANSNASAATDSNTTLTPAPTPAPVIVYAPVDVSNATLAGHKGLYAIVNQITPTLCMSVAGFPNSAALGVATCQGAGADSFAFDGNGRIAYPSQQITLSGVSYNKGAYCLGVGMAGHANSGQAVLMPCNSGDRSQIWGQAGNVLVSATAKTCLGFDPNGQNPNAILLQPCTTRPQQAWMLQQ